LRQAHSESDRSVEYLLRLMRCSVGHRFIPSSIYQTVSEGVFSETHIQPGESLCVRTGGKSVLVSGNHSTRPQDIVVPNNDARIGWQKEEGPAALGGRNPRRFRYLRGPPGRRRKMWVIYPAREAPNAVSRKSSAEHPKLWFSDKGPPTSRARRQLRRRETAKHRAKGRSPR
jgi:hypothetical protein